MFIEYLHFDELKKAIDLDNVTAIAIDPFQYFHHSGRFEDHYIPWHHCSSQINIGYLIDGLNDQTLSCLKKYATLNVQELDKQIMAFFIHSQKRNRQFQLEQAASGLLHSYTKTVGIGMVAILGVVILIFSAIDGCRYCRDRNNQNRTSKAKNKENGGDSFEQFALANS